tara:strand:+ start:5469 stop:6665 length:1197 start_codon:yes stop_codon:yes gene_type:complete
MEFFDRKEEVLDVQLTQYGKYLLSVGKLKPVYYSFFDNDVDYDTKYQGLPPNDSSSDARTGPPENQKDTEDRIKETPRIKAIHSVDTVEKSVNQIAFGDFVLVDLEDNIFVDAYGGAIFDESALAKAIEKFKTEGEGSSFAGTGRSGGSIFKVAPLSPVDKFLNPTFSPDPSRSYRYPVPKKQNLVGLEIPLGTSGYNDIYYPAFDLNFKKGKISDSIYYDSSPYGIVRIPQLEVEVTFETTIGQIADGGKSITLNDILSVKDSAEAVEFDYSIVTSDGTFVKIEEDYISIDLKELHSLNEKEDFYVEVYEIEDVAAGRFSDSKSERMLPLRFGGDYFSDLYSQYLYDKTGNNLKVSENYVEYFFKVSCDDEIQTAQQKPSDITVPPENVFDLCEDEV